MSERAVGLDVGLAKDRSVAARCRRDSSGLVVVEALETWSPRPGEKVDLLDVEAGVAALARAQNAPIIVDPWQAALMAQRLRAQGFQVTEYAFTPGSRRKLFGTLLDLIRRDQLRSRPHDDLRRELLSLEVQETSAGWRVDHRVGRHDDHVVAVALACCAIVGKESRELEIHALGEGLSPHGEEPESEIVTEDDLADDAAPAQVEE